MSAYSKNQNSKINYIKIYTKNAENYKERVQKKTFDFIKYDIGLFSIVSWLFSESFQKYTGLFIVIIFSFGFFWKIFLIATQFKEFFPKDNDFWNQALESNYDQILMDKKFYATQFEAYRKTNEYYRPKMIQVNCSIILSFFGIFLILFTKALNEYEKKKVWE